MVMIMDAALYCIIPPPAKKCQFRDALLYYLISNAYQTK